MATVTEHYERLLAPVYLWMAGGAEAALAAGAAEIEALGLPGNPGDLVVDLGAGFGMHAIPLARRGASVTAIDTSAELLQTLGDLRGGLPVQTVVGDLLSFNRHLDRRPAAILCMGDTLTHLTAFDQVTTLIREAAAVLPAGGMLALSFRDYTTSLTDGQRFIPVRSDDGRILTCFLEYEPHAVIVHDILHERSADGWRMRVSHYRKQRLPPDSVTNQLEHFGFRVRREPGLGGMVRLVAHRR